MDHLFLVIYSRWSRTNWSIFQTETLALVGLGDDFSSISHVWLNNRAPNNIHYPHDSFTYWEMIRLGNQ